MPQTNNCKIDSFEDLYLYWKYILNHIIGPLCCKNVYSIACKLYLQGLGTKPVNAILNVTSAGNIGIDIKSQSCLKICWIKINIMFHIRLCFCVKLGVFWWPRLGLRQTTSYSQRGTFPCCQRKMPRRCENNKVYNRLQVLVAYCGVKSL